MTGDKQEQMHEQGTAAQSGKTQSEGRYEMDRDRQGQNPYEYEEDQEGSPYPEDAKPEPCEEEPAQEEPKRGPCGEEPEKDPCEELRRDKEQDREASPECGRERETELVCLKRGLRKMENELQEAKQDWENKQKELAAMQADVTALQKSSQEIESICDDYEKANCELVDQLEGLRAYAASKRKLLKAALDKNVAECLDKKCKELGHDIEEMECCIRELEAFCSLTVGEGSGEADKCDCDCDDLTDAVFPNNCAEIDCEETVQFATVQRDNALKGPQGVEAREAVYNALKGHKKTLQDMLKQAEDLKAQIDKEEEDGDAKHYVLLCDLDELLDEIANWLWTPDDFCKNLNCAWKCLNAAREKLRDRKKVLDEREAELAALEAQLQQARENRVERILEFIQM